jgi:hypothetical protein
MRTSQRLEIGLCYGSGEIIGSEGLASNSYFDLIPVALQNYGLWFSGAGRIPKARPEDEQRECDDNGSAVQHFVSWVLPKLRLSHWSGSLTSQPIVSNKVVTTGSSFTGFPGVIKTM